MILKISLCLHGEFLNPEEVTKVLNLSPVRSHRKADIYVTSSGSKIIRKAGYWKFTVEHCDFQIEKTIDKLLNLLEMQNFDLVKINHVEQAYIDIFFAKKIFENEIVFRMDLNREIIQRIEKFGLSIQFDLFGSIDD